jgi:hypothetical protein
MVDMTEYLPRRLRLMKSRIFYNPNAAGADRKKVTQMVLFYGSQCWIWLQPFEANYEG